MTKTDKRTRSEAQRRKTQADRLARADDARRKRKWQISADAASHAGYPINAFITIMAGNDIATITETAWRKLRQMLRKNGSLFVAVRAPEYTPAKGHHLHIALHLQTENYADAITVLTETVSEEVGSWGVDPNGRSVGDRSGVVAISKNGCWMLQRHQEFLNGSPAMLVGYAAKGSGKRKAIGRHQRSADLLAMTKRHGQYSAILEPPAGAECV
jgi:hypothetical protein